MKVDHSVDPSTLDPRTDVGSAEAAGFDGVWLSEIKHDPFLGVALATTATNRVTLGTGIALAFARNPMSTAVLANDLQALSGGRVLLGLGTQVKAHITRRFAMPWSRPAARMREYVLAMRAIWESWHTGAPLRFDGEFYTHTLMTPMFVPQEHPHGGPKVAIAGVGETMTEIAGEVADAYLPHGFTTERYLREVSLPALRRGTAKRELPATDFAVCGSPMVATGDTAEQLAAATAQVRGQIAFYGSTPAYRSVLALHGWGELGDELHVLSRAGRWDDMPALVSDEVLHTFAIVAEPAAVGPEIVRRYGDLLDRVTLYGPVGRDAATAAAIRTGTTATAP